MVESSGVKKGFFRRLKEEVEEERSKPVRLSPLNIVYVTLVIAVVLAFVLLAFYILKNVNLLNTNPCSLCEDLGNTVIRGGLGG